MTPLALALHCVLQEAATRQRWRNLQISCKNAA